MAGLRQGPRFAGKAAHPANPRCATKRNTAERGSAVLPWVGAVRLRKVFLERKRHQPIEFLLGRFGWVQIPYGNNEAGRRAAPPRPTPIEFSERATLPAAQQPELGGRPRRDGALTCSQHCESRNTTQHDSPRYQRVRTQLR